MIKTTGLDMNSGNHSTQFTFLKFYLMTSSAAYSASDPTGAVDPYQWSPVPSLQRSDADVTLMMLAQNAITYLAPSNDPWMPAHLTAEGNGIRIWVGDYDVNLMGCIDQYQICNPNIPGDAGCTALSGSVKVMNSLGQPEGLLGMNAEQRWTIQRFLVTSIFRSMFYAVQGRGASALNGSFYAHPISFSLSALFIFN
jgi:hypothetical protein